VLIIVLLAWLPASAGEQDRVRRESRQGWVATPTASPDREQPLREQPLREQPLREQLLRLADLEQMAFRQNPTLAGATARIQAAQGRQTQAGLFPNPVIGYHGTEIGNRGTAGQQGGFISQRFITAGKLQLDQQIAGQDITAARLRLHSQEQRVLSDVRVRFYAALAAQKRLEFTRKLVRIGDELVAATRTLLAGRLGTENDLLQAEIRVDESRILLDNARNQQAEAWRRLSAVIGSPHMPMVPLSGDLTESLPELEWDTCLQTVLDSNPELNAARTRVERAEITILRAKKEPIPNVDLSVSVRRHTITDSDVANVQVGIPIPIFDRNQGNVHAAEAEWVAARKDIQRIELDLQDRLAVSYQKYASARQQAERYGQRMLPRAGTSLTLVTEGYQTGQVKYLTLLTAQQTYVRVNLSYLDALLELRTSSAIITGQLFRGSLANRR